MSSHKEVGSSVREQIFDDSTEEQQQEDPGPLQQLRREFRSSHDPCGNQHRHIKKQEFDRIKYAYYWTTILACFMLFVVGRVSIVFFRALLNPNDVLLVGVLEFFIPQQGCVSRNALNVYLWLLIAVWCPAAAVTWAHHCRR